VDVFMSGGQEFATDRFTPFQALVMEDFRFRVPVRIDSRIENIAMPHSAPQGKPEVMQG
jgi:hypothetical protein